MNKHIYGTCKKDYESIPTSNKNKKEIVEFLRL